MQILIQTVTAIPFVLIWLAVVWFLRRKKQASLVYLIFFTIFSIYIFKVLDYTLFQFQSLLLLKQFIPNLMLNGQAAGDNLNLIPLVALTSADVKTSLLNILLFVPFGFGLPFITKLRMMKVVVFGALLSISIELLQLITGLLAGMTFRIADINDVVFNTTGAVIGYLLFVGFVSLFRKATDRSNLRNNALARYVIERPQVST